MPLGALAAASAPFPTLSKGNAMLSYYPPRQRPAKPNRRAGKGRSFRQLCETRGYSAKLTAALLATANRRAVAGLPIVWPNAS